jgi:membrane fusion protein, adhesin transport system
MGLASLSEQTNTARSLQRVSSRPAYYRIALVALLLFAFLVACLVFVPWQQVVTGVGKVMVFDPQSRPQAIQAQIGGRIDQWHVRDGQYVKAGDLLVSLKEIDPKYLDPNQLSNLLRQQAAIKSRQQAIRQRLAALRQQQGSVVTSQQQSVPAAQERLKQSLDRNKQAQQTLIAARQALETATYNWQRLQELNNQGLRSRRDRELAELDYVRAKTEVDRLTAALQVAKRDITVAEFDASRVQADTNASVTALDATAASAEESLASSEGDLQKLGIELASLKQRAGQRMVKAPLSGRIVKVMSVGQGETVAEGDTLAIIAPETGDQAVALNLSDNDIPLVRVGSPVRLQFAGWPAIQFTGWPAASVGTFAGRVAAIDAVDDGKSRFRVIVQPDKAKMSAATNEQAPQHPYQQRNILGYTQHKEQPWPSPTVLRPGSKVIGWVMLQPVPLWFELWRQFNGFPPNFPQDELVTDDSKGVDTGAESSADSKKDDAKAKEKATKRKAKNK